MSADKFKAVIVQQAMDNFLGSDECTEWCDRMRRQDEEWAFEEAMMQMLRVQAPDRRIKQ